MWGVKKGNTEMSKNKAAFGDLDSALDQQDGGDDQFQLSGLGDQRQAEAGRTFSDNFNSFNTWNGHHGLDTVGGPQWSDFGHVSPDGTKPWNYEQGFYVNADSSLAKLVDPFSVDHGVLTITAAPVTNPNVLSQISLDYKDNHFPAPYTTGMINTDHSFSQTYGYFEMKAELPSSKGFLPAFWLLPTDGSHAEIDIMEVLGSDPTKLYTTAHSFAGGTETDPGTSTVVADTSKGFHTYGVDWEKNTITWYFDGHKVFQTATPSDLNKPMYMIANLAVGGGWPGDADGVTTASMKIEYIRAYSAMPTGEANSNGHEVQLTGLVSTHDQPHH